MTPNFEGVNPQNAHIFLSEDMKIIVIKINDKKRKPMSR